jgi:Xaa-Pro aminopeptidase
VTSEDRRRALVAALPEDIDGMLVTALPNVRYLSGFSGSNGAVLIGRDGVTLLATDGRYGAQASEQAPDLQLLVTRDVAPELVAAAKKQGCRRLGIERTQVTLAVFDRLHDAGDGLGLIGVDGAVEALRMRKDDAKIAALRRACAITDIALEDVLRRLVPGVTEREVEGFLLKAMHGAGAEGAAFPCIVAFGPHSAIPHHQPGDRPLQRGDLIKLDFGACVDGYHADMTRTVVCGPAQDWQRELHARVASIQTRCREATVAGAVPVELDALAQELVSESGHELVHGLGHGVGLQIHEAPFLVPNSSAPTLEAGVPVTVEPGIYLPARGGVRIEDTIVVTAGAPQLLTHSSRELIEV